MFLFNTVLGVFDSIMTLAILVFLEWIYRFLCWTLAIKSAYWTATKNGRHKEEIKEQFPYYSSKNPIYKSFMCGLGDIVSTLVKVVRRIVNVIYIILFSLCVANIIAPSKIISSIYILVYIFLFGSMMVRWLYTSYTDKLKLKIKRKK